MWENFSVFLQALGQFSLQRLQTIQRVQAKDLSSSWPQITTFFLMNLVITLVVSELKQAYLVVKFLLLNLKWKK